MTASLRRRVLAALALAILCVAPAAHAASPFANCAAVVVAGDWHAHSGGPTEAFDNARRDVAQELTKLGFAKDNIAQFSVRPALYPAQAPLPSDLQTIGDTLRLKATTATAGCVVYFTSHGGPPGILLDQGVVSPGQMGQLIDDACPNRPTVVVLSACYSGVFVPILSTNDRMILTAARPDRSSFGCGESDKYPFFDDCFLSSAPKAHDFPALGAAVQACVAAKEMELGASPPSEPQMWIGPRLKPMLPLYAFSPSG